MLTVCKCLHASLFDRQKGAFVSTQIYFKLRRWNTLRLLMTHLLNIENCMSCSAKTHFFSHKQQVRFKLASSYSGRVLKHVYEDGQELDSPEEKYPHSFVHRKIPPSHLEMEQFCSFEDTHGDQQGEFFLFCNTHFIQFTSCF